MRLTPKDTLGLTPVCPERLVGSDRGLPGLELETDAVIEGVAIRFARRDQNILARLGAIGVLDGGVDLLEKAEVVEAALALEHVAAG